ncbi:MAG: UDP-N-acetylmuramoyl-L-alanine--D-glutamate ligase, partial [bacterium]
PVLIDDAPADKLASVLEKYSGKFTQTFFGDQSRDWSKILDNVDTIIISPGIKLPEDVDHLAYKKNVEIICEIEFAFRRCKGKIIAVTGSNGKSTTVTMVYQILQLAGFPSYLAGNIGTPFISIVDDIQTGDWVVLELSSYQLERIDTFKPDIAIITNITEDHLARHGDMFGYIAAKGRIFENQDLNDHAIINHENFSTWRALGKCASNLHAFTTEETEALPSREVINGKFIQFFAAQNEKVLVLKKGEEMNSILPAIDLQVVGQHNIENALCSSLATYLAGVPLKAIGDALREFKGIEHRIEFLGLVNDVRIYNDSKATNVESTITALKTFTEGNLRLILGGSEKGSDFTPLWQFLQERDDGFILYLSGPSGLRMSEDLKNGNWNFNYHKFDSFDKCVMSAFNGATGGDIVLLSPACASFDEFSSFEERGQRFKKLFHKMVEEK